MSEQITITVKKPVAYTVGGIFFIVMISGYIANYNARSELNTVSVECSQCNEQKMHAQEQMKFLQQKNDESSAQLTQITQENQNLIEKEKEFTAKLEALQIKYDVLSKKQNGSDPSLTMPVEPSASKPLPNDVKSPDDKNTAITPGANSEATPPASDVLSPEHPTAR